MALLRLFEHTALSRLLTRLGLQGKAKHSQWEKVKGLTPEEAQKQYVEAVKKLIAKYN